MSTAVNPFQFTKPVAPGEIIDREKEVAALKAFAEEGNNARLVAPRRYGKTSVIGRVQADLGDEGWIPVYVDLLGILSVDELAARIELAYSRQLRGRLAQWFTGIRRTFQPALTLGGGPVPASASIRLSELSHSRLEERLALPRRIFEKTGNRVHVVFDEFHEVLRIGHAADAVIRSVIQHDGRAASYVFAGSEVGMMEELFASPDRNRAFYTQAAPVTLISLRADALASYVSARFEESGKELAAEALDALLVLVDGHPQRAMLAAHELWTVARSRADLGDWANAYDRIMALVHAELTQLWSSLGIGERNAVVAIASGVPPYSGRAGTRGGAVRSALEQLRRGGIVSRQNSVWTIIDPLFRMWLQHQRIDGV